MGIVWQMLQHGTRHAPELQKFLRDRKVWEELSSGERFAEGRRVSGHEPSGSNLSWRVLFARTRSDSTAETELPRIPPISS